MLDRTSPLIWVSVASPAAYQIRLVAKTCLQGRVGLVRVSSFLVVPNLFAGLRFWEIGALPGFSG